MYDNFVEGQHARCELGAYRRTLFSAKYHIHTLYVAVWLVDSNIGFLIAIKSAADVSSAVDVVMYDPFMTAWGDGGFTGGR